MASTGFADSYLVFSFLKRLVKPFDQWKAYQTGVIDTNGEVKVPPEKRTDEQNESFKMFDLLLLNLKKILAKVPGGGSKLATYAAALYLVKEELTKEQAENLQFVEESFIGYLREEKDLEKFVHAFEDKMPASLEKQYKDLKKAMEDLRKKAKEIEKKYHVNEEAPVNNVGSGNVAGMSPNDVPGRIPANRKTDKKRQDIRMAMFRRTGHPVEKALVKEDLQFAGSKVFDVDFDSMWRSRHGKPPYHRYAKYVGTDDCGLEITEYCRNNPKKSVVLRDQKSGAMVYFRKELSEQFELNEGLFDSLMSRAKALRLKMKTVRIRRAAANDNSAQQRFDRELATLRQNLGNLDQQLARIKAQRY